MMKLNERKQKQIVESLLTNLRMCNASSPDNNDKRLDLITGIPNTYNRQKALTIPVNNIETIPDRLRPSASIYLKIEIYFQIKFLTNATEYRRGKEGGNKNRILIQGWLTRSKGKGQRGSTPSFEDWEEKQIEVVSNPSYL